MVIPAMAEPPVVAEVERPQWTTAQLEDFARRFERFRQTLLGWPWWSEAQRQQGVSFAEGGGIEHMGIKVGGAFESGVATYADLEFNMLRLRASRGERVEGIVRDRWERDLTSRQIADARHISLTTVTECIRDGTTRLAELVTRVPDCRKRVFDFLEDLGRHHDYFGD